MADGVGQEALDRLVDSVRQEGYREGLAEGRAPGQDTAAQALDHACEELSKLREELLGRVEGQYKLRGETCPLSVQKQTVAELEATLAELRGERAAGDE